jgi:hypothetical protein
MDARADVAGREAELLGCTVEAFRLLRDRASRDGETVVVSLPVPDEPGTVEVRATTDGTVAAWFR